jgi:formate dehydrogenase iron-sulfur subunit
MNFGERTEMLNLAQKRLTVVRRTYRGAMLLDPDDIRVIFMVTYDPTLYHEHAVASSCSYGISRHAALRRMWRPLKNWVANRV